MHKRELKELTSVTTAQLVAAATILGFGDQQEYSDDQAQAIVDYFAPSARTQAHLPTQPPTSEQSTGLVSGMARVVDGINAGVEQILFQRDRFVEDTSHLVAHEIASTPYAIESRVSELLSEIGIIADADIVFPSISRASKVLAEPLRRQSRVEKRSLNPADYLMLTASCVPY